MTKTISLDVPDDSYEKLVSLSKYYGQDIRETILGILEEVASQASLMKTHARDCNKPAAGLACLFEAATYSAELFDEILKQLRATNLCRFRDFNFYPEGPTFEFSYAPLKDSGLCIDHFYVVFQLECIYLSAYLPLEVAKVGKESLEKLEQLVYGYYAGEESFERVLGKGISVELDGKNAESWDIIVTCKEGSLEDFPSLPQLSHFVMQMLKKAGIQQRDTC